MSTAKEKGTLLDAPLLDQLSLIEYRWLLVFKHTVRFSSHNRPGRTECRSLFRVWLVPGHLEHASPQA